MTTTTTFGTWNNFTHSNISPAGDVLDYISGGESEWQDQVRSSGAFDRMVADYRDAVNAALPDGVSLCGDEFIGPAYDKDYTWDGELDIAQIIEDVDLSAIVQRHDPDNAA